MINLHNYALLAEQKKYGYDTSIAESIDTINEAGPDMQTQDGLNKVMGGKTDPNYTAQWNQLVDDIAARKKAAGTYTVTIIHDNQKPMVTLEYQIGTDGKPIKTSVKLASVAAAASGNASDIDINLFLGYDPKGKFNEFIAALITISIEKFGKSWTKAHIDWVNRQINKVSEYESFNTIKGQYESGGFVNSPILKGDGDVFTPWINPLTGGDRPTQIDAIGRVNKIAGSATTDAQVNMILQTINVKLQESIIQFTDERAIHGLYMLISPKYTAGQIVTMYQAITGGQGGLLTTIKSRGASDDSTTTYKGPFVQWLVGTRGSQNNSDIVKSYKNFDMASYSASLAKLKECLK
jgi:hypothetical protein